jgi:rhodanese-related sulfurtransferase
MRDMALMRFRFPLAWVLLTAPLLAQAGKPSAEDLEAGKNSYRLLCQNCHGDDGDALNYVDIIPVAGIRRRYPADVIGRLSGAFSGRVLQGKDRERVVQYMSALRGAKGFADPGWLITPYMLEKKSPRIHEFRVLDVRGEQDYAASHVPNAVSVASGSCLANSDETVQWLAQLGVTPATLVVVYDETGGPAAACAWWRIRRAGHSWVAVLDGGWKRWTAERRRQDSVIPAIKRAVYPLSASTAGSAAPRPVAVLSLSARGWNWQRTLDGNGFRPDDELLRLAESAGLRPGAAFRISGPPDQLAHLSLVLHLLGYEPGYDAAASVMWLGPGS